MHTPNSGKTDGIVSIKSMENWYDITMSGLQKKIGNPSVVWFDRIFAQCFAFAHPHTNTSFHLKLQVGLMYFCNLNN